MKYPLTVIANLHIVEGDLVCFNEYVSIKHVPSGETYSAGELPKHIREFFCEGDDLSRKFLEEEFGVVQVDATTLQFTYCFDPQGRKAEDKIYCDCVGTHTVDLKWSAWSNWESHWADYATDTYAAIKGLKPGQEIVIKSFPRKECRGLEVTIRRLYPSMWVAVGAAWSCWDSASDLLCTLNLLETTDAAAVEFMRQATGPDREIDYEKANELAIKAGYAGITDFDAFNESVPYSHRTWEPGLDYEINVKANTFEKLMAKIDKCENELLKLDQEEWSLFEKMYTNH